LVAVDSVSQRRDQLDQLISNGGLQVARGQFVYNINISIELICPSKIKSKQATKEQISNGIS
jgi:hypothetical protein